MALALADRELEGQEREELALAIYSTPRGEVQMGHPTFPVLEWLGDEPRRPRLATLVTPNSWLIFERLGLGQVKQEMCALVLLDVPGVAAGPLLRLAPHPRLPEAGDVRQEPARHQ